MSGKRPVTPRKVAARPRAAARADAIARRLFEDVHIGVFSGALAVPGSGAGDAVHATNPYLRVILGYPAGTADAKVAPFAAERFVEADARDTFLRRLATDGAVRDYPLLVRKANGSPTWVEVTAGARPSRSPGVLRVDALVRDVSERKRLDDQTRDIYQQILQSEKMAALGQTVSGVAHELNNPLATILSWAERLSEKPLDDLTKRGVGVILGEAERAARIVRNLLTFARKRQSTRGQVDVNAIVHQTLSLRGYERLPTLAVDTELDPDVPPVFADAHQLQQILLNLVINAEQAMLAANGRGRLSVRTRHDTAHDQVVLEVSDDGPGVPVEARTRIFDPFFTTKGVGKGTGLGLTVAYAIVQEHGGRIRVESATGQGATFVVELPVSGGTEGVLTKPRGGMPPMDAARGASILIVEDEPALASAVVEALTDAGLRVDHASDGQEALGRIRNTSYDVIVCDLRMPRVDGMTLYRTVAAATPTLARRFVFVTGDMAGTDAEHFLEATGCRWLPKPFRLSDLLRAVRDTLA